MTPEEAVQRLDEIPSGDPEGAHCMADDILLDLVSEEVQSAYSRLIGRCAWWACA